MKSEAIVPQRLIHALATWAWSAWIGLSYGLALSRLLYESDPLRFSLLGRLGPTLALAALLALVGHGLLWVVRQDSGLFQTIGGITAALLWIHILAPALDVNPLRGVILLIGAFALWAALMSPRLVSGLPAWSGTVTVAAVALVAYVLTLQRTIGRADSFEFQVTAPVLGVAHPTGYPLLILLGKLFSLLPLSSKIAVRINLVSVVAAVIAIAALFETFRRALRADRYAAGLAALAFGLSPTLWSQAVIAEVYALHSTFVATILGLALWLVAIPISDAGSNSTAQPSILAWRPVLTLFVLLGLSLTNHLTTVLLLPGIALALYLARPSLQGRQWLLAVLALLAGLLVYAYIPIRWPALHDGQPMPLAEFMGWVTGSRFAGALDPLAWLKSERWAILGRLIHLQYGWAGVALGIAGLIALTLRNRRAAAVTAITFATQGLYGLCYLVPDIGVFLIPLYLILAIWIGYGASTLIQLAGAFIKPPQTIWIQTTILTALTLLPLSSAWRNGPTFNWAAEQELEDWGRYVLSLPLAQDSAILADSEKIAPLEYLHRIEVLRPDMQMVVLGSEQDYFANLYTRLAAGQTVYLARFLPGLEGTYHLRSVGPLIEVGTEALTEIPEPAGEPHHWTNGIVLLGYHLEISEQAGPIQPGQIVHLTLYWQAPEVALSNNYQVRLRLVASDGKVGWESKPAYPVDNRYPTGAWKAQEIVTDYHAIRLPYTLLNGPYTLQVGLALPFSERFETLSEGDPWADLADLDIAPLKNAPLTGRRTALVAGDTWLTGINAPERTPTGASIELVASWLIRPPGGDPRAFWTQNASLAAEGSSPLPIDGLVVKRALLEETQAQVLTWELSGRPMRCAWLGPIRDTCQVASTRIEGTATTQAIANFDNQILLMAVDFQARRLQPGQAIPVQLQWQALRRMAEDYTVFIHLLGPDGRLYGQVDSWPVQGTFPTSAWTPGEYIIDNYVVTLLSDAPPGNYQLEIGIYLLRTNTRLNIVNENGEPIDDKVLLGGLSVP